MHSQFTTTTSNYEVTRTKRKMAMRIFQDEENDDFLFTNFARRNSTEEPLPKKRGPCQSSVQAKIYYLPDSASLPSSFDASNEHLKLHMQQGYGKLSYYLILRE